MFHHRFIKIFCQVIGNTYMYHLWLANFQGHMSNFRVTHAKKLSERGHIWGFQAFSGEHMEAYVWDNASFSNLWLWWFAFLGPVSLRLMTSQFKYIVTHTQKLETVKCIFCGVWVQNFAWNFKGALWNFTQNFEPIHRKICILRGVKDFTTYDILELWYLKS